ncbi:hypothetical protein PAECIP111893_03199 [Paenibacillus plantiphilus]|uniref:RNA polymerase sigma factor n=1 Tax=Paenibacillus plantiphilus TaxID=2905650 RepID=A0ABN8GJ39_9BACL|nr:RNA polymerase sigma factor [Paenibacillus plantiphilus]CAH1210323.1 hypothetical protein PAECIP111893_03199 [Paenibacillus plantiphilus]
MISNGEGTEMIRAALYKFCLTLTESIWDAEDLVQEAFLRALPVISGSCPHPNPTAYVLRIAKNLWVDGIRHSRMKERVTVKLVDETVSIDNYDRFELEEALCLITKQLSPLQRTVFLLRDVCCYRGSEVAEWLQTTEGAVKAALNRARAALDACKGNQLHKGDEDRAELDASLFHAYLSALRQHDPLAIIKLAMAQNDSVTTVQAIGRSEGQSSSGRSRQQVTEAFCHHTVMLFAS